MEIELASISGECGNVALHIPENDYRKYFENPIPNDGAAAFWEDGGNPNGGGLPQGPDEEIVWVYGQWTIQYVFDGEPRTSGGGTEGSRKAPLSVVVIPAGEGMGGKVVVIDGDGATTTDWGPRSNSDFTPITEITITNISITRADNGLPYEPPNDGGSGEPPEKFVIVKTVHLDGSMSEIHREPLEQKPKKIWLSCEECQSHCVPTVRNPGDDYEESICLCKEESKDPEPDEENMKARIKAELLAEMPPIVVARFQATEEARFIDKVAQGTQKLIKPDLKDIVESILFEADEDGVSVLETAVLNALNTDIENLPNLYISLRGKLITDPDFLTGIKESLTKDKYTFTSLIAQLDDKNITDLRTKMKIPLNPDDPKNPSNNDLTANGFKWEVVKDGNAIDKVQRTVEPADNLTAVLNSGYAIAGALQAKYGKQFTVDSSTQADGKVMFDVTEVPSNA